MDAVRRIVTREFPTRTITSATPVKRGSQKETTVVTFADGSAVVVQRADDAKALAIESALARRIRSETSIPVPRQLAHGTLAGSAYVVVERAEGTDLHTQFAGFDSTRQRALAAAFGQYLAAIHELCVFDAFGDVVWNGGSRRTGGDLGRAGEFRVRGTDNWETWFRAYALAGVASLPSAFGDFYEPLNDVFTSARLPTHLESRLYPWDFRPGNALVRDGTLTAVLDWGDPLAAAPGLSVAKAEHLVCDWYVASGEPLRAAFRRGYEIVRRYPTVVPAYRLAAIVHAAVDSSGHVTRPRFPERTGTDAVAFHRTKLAANLPD